MKPSRLETTCSVTVDLIALGMFLPDEADAGPSRPSVSYSAAFEPDTIRTIALRRRFRDI
jgi:hypothetical protein